MLIAQARRGFTIVELLIVIVVIGVLAAITIVAYNGIQSRAQQQKINTDLSQIQKAIISARVSTGEKALRYITGSTGSAGACVNTNSDVDLADTTAASACWTAYNNAMNTISTASNINVRNLKDPWGRPYYLDENEQEGTTNPPCGVGKDNLGAFPNPRVQANWGFMTGTVRQIPYVTPGC